MAESPKKIVIVGGVAAGMSCAARCRRLSETVEITVLERGPHVSFANCGLPYYVGGEIAPRAKLLRSAEDMAHNLNITIRTRTPAVAIDRAGRRVAVQTPEGKEEHLPYDVLVLATGASPLRPPIPGIDRPGLFSVRNVPDADAIQEWIKKVDARRAVVVGGGYIGLEMAEQFQHRGLEVSVVEVQDQIMAPVDVEMARLLEEEMEKHGVALYLGDGVASFDEPAAGEKSAAATVVLKSGTRLPGDVVILGLGVRPDVGLAKSAGLEIGARGGLRVDAQLRTNDPAIYAAGDAVEVRDTITGEWAIVPLAGPANRQGRMIADNIFGRGIEYTGTQGTAVLRLFSLTAACTGANEKRLRAAGIAYQGVHLHPANHAGYFPGAQRMALKVLFSPETGKLLGAQAVGGDGVDKRIDVLATALAAGMTMDQIAQLELCYAPPYGSAKDPVNMAGMAAENMLRNMVRVVHWNEVPDGPEPLILDVRNANERDAGAIPGSIHIPLGELRGRLDELPRDKPIIVHCQSGQRSYTATRILTLNGFDAMNLSGSYLTWSPATRPRSGAMAATPATDREPHP